MSATGTGYLYHLLPALYRLRDAEQGEPLRALLSILEAPRNAVEEDIRQLYENWFIETCEEWVVPYIGDLLGVLPLHPVSDATFSARAYVAHTLRYRRGKGTAATLEGVAADVTGWPAHAVEFFELIATTQYMNHVRADSPGTIAIRDAQALELLDSPFERAPHTVDVRHIDVGRGKYGIPNVGLFFWRLQNFIVSNGVAQLAVAVPDGRYLMNPLGYEEPLYNHARSKTRRLLAESQSPGALRLRAIYEELEQRRQAIVDKTDIQGDYFTLDPVFQVRIDGTLVDPSEILVCRLDDDPVTGWRRPPASKSYVPAAGGAPVAMKISLSVDPSRGRLALPIGMSAKRIEVSFNYAFSGEVGAGTYDRGKAVAAVLGEFAKPWQVAVTTQLPAVPHQVFNNLSDAIADWNNQKPGTDGIIAILDNQTYLETPAQILIPGGSRLFVVSADWPSLRKSVPPSDGILVADLLRPHVRGNLLIRGAAKVTEAPGKLFMDGLLLEGSITLSPGNLGLLQLAHCTLQPGAGSISVQSSGDVRPNAEQDNENLQVNLIRSICGPVLLDATIPEASATDCILSSGAKSDGSVSALSAKGAHVALDSVTVFGTVNAETLEATNSIFVGPVTVDRRQSGCVRFCYVADGSLVPRRYRCQPDLALQGITDPVVAGQIRLRLTPTFTSKFDGDPGYAQLAVRCPSEILTGADDGSEMGVFRFLQQPQREANLRAILDEYLRFGLEAGSFFVS